MAQRQVVSRWLFAAAAATLALTACGGSDGDAGSGGTGTPAPAPSPGSPAPSPSPVPPPSPTPSPAPSPPPAAPPPPPIAVTAAGIPEGLPASATIGAAGGSLTSGDGLLTVSVPAGALAADTVIGIQPITATAPGALGLAYRLTPEGATFAQPVTLRFTYSADEAAANAQDLLQVVTRDARGYWIAPTTTRDASGRTLSVTATHFSDWSYVGGLQIAPASATVGVNKKVFLKVVDCGNSPDPDAVNQQRVLLECRTALHRDQPSAWSVNGIVNGNATVGTITTIPDLLEFAGYTAPAAAPPQNPVAVSAQVDRETGRLTLVSNIKVVDELTVYAGTIFGRTDMTIQGQTQFFEMSANLRFTYNPSLSIGGAQWYDGTGSAFVRGRSIGCTTDGSGTAPVQGATLQLHTEGPLAGTYAISSSAIATVTMSCGDPPQQVTVSLVGAAGAGGSDICPSLPIGDEPGRLVGSWQCNVAEGSTQRSNWTLRAVE